MSKIIIRNKSNHLSDEESIILVASSLKDIGKSERYVRYVFDKPKVLTYGISLVKNKSSITFIVWDSRRNEKKENKNEGI